MPDSPPGTDGDLAVADRPTAATQPEHRLALGNATGWFAAERTRSRIAAVLAGALVASGVACGVLAWQRAHEEPSPASQRATARDDARAATLHAVETLMSADHRDATGTYDRWSGVTTGRLHAQLGGQRAAIVKKLRTTKEVTSVHTVDAALTSWDDAAGTARLLTVLELRTSSGKESDTRKVHYLALAQRVDDAWLLSAVQQIGAVS